MVEKVIRQARNVVDFASYRRGRNIAGLVQPVSARTCRHCGAALSDGEQENECSSIANAEAALRWQAAQILRGLI